MADGVDALRASSDAAAESSQAMAPGVTPADQASAAAVGESWEHGDETNASAPAPPEPDAIIAMTSTVGVETLVCGKCRHPLVRPADLITARIDTWADAVYAYELDVLDSEGVFCYSATNPGDTRFDVVRSKPSSTGLVTHGDPTPEHSWFPGFLWSFAHCGACDAHLGWGFSLPVAPDPESENQPPNPPVVEFYGLVLTKLGQEVISEDGVQEAAAQLDRVRAHRGQYEADVGAAIQMLNAVPVAIAQQFYPSLFEMDQHPAERTRSGTFLDAVRTVFEDWRGGNGGMVDAADSEDADSPPHDDDDAEDEDSRVSDPGPEEPDAGNTDSI
eukprot:m.38817 g.38817  ORF g.38817 m.38817 type:complete len:331 (-) comp13513_c0_seq1:1969-2961(-)